MANSKCSSFEQNIGKLRHRTSNGRGPTLVEAITSAHGHRKFHKGNVRSECGPSWRRSIREEASRERTYGRTGRGREEGGREGGGESSGGLSPACTWQSKEAINHEDNASPPLSEPRSSLGSEELPREDTHERRKKREERRFGRRSGGGIRAGDVERRSAQKVNRLPGLLVLLTNFSIHRPGYPAPSVALLSSSPPQPPTLRAPPYPPFLQLISSRPRRSGHADVRRTFNPDRS